MKTNKWVLDKIGNSLVLRSQMMERKLKFFGHVMRHESFEKGIIQGMVEAKRKRGRPPKEWMDDIKGWTGLKLGFHRYGCSMRHPAKNGHSVNA